jgi:hypothetical protein
MQPPGRVPSTAKRERVRVRVRACGSTSPADIPCRTKTFVLINQICLDPIDLICRPIVVIRDCLGIDDEGSAAERRIRAAAEPLSRIDWRRPRLRWRAFRRPP